MRELSDDEVQNINSSRLSEWRDPAEKWFSFEHSGVWREITRQFLGATQSHGELTHRDLFLRLVDEYQLMPIRPKSADGLASGISMACGHPDADV